MPTPAVVSIALQHRGASARAADLLRLEQQKWGDNTGEVTAKDALYYLAGRIFADLQGDASLPVCGLDDDGCMSCIIYAYPAVPTLAYTLAASRGTISPGIRETIEEEELVIFSADNHATLKYPAAAIKGSSWDGPVFDEDLGFIMPPTPVFDGDDVALDIKVNGRLLVKYTITRHSHLLRVPPRPEAKENKFSSTVFGRWDYGIKGLIIDPPPHADSNAESTTPCGWGGETDDGGTDIGDGGDDYTPPVPGHHDGHKKTDYCTQIVTQKS